MLGRAIGTNLATSSVCWECQGYKPSARLRCLDSNLCVQAHNSNTGTGLLMIDSGDLGGIIAPESSVSQSASGRVIVARGTVSRECAHTHPKKRPTHPAAGPGSVEVAK